MLLAFLVARGWLRSARGGFIRNSSAEGFIAYPLVRVWPNPPSPEDAALKTLYEELPSGVYRLLFENKETLFCSSCRPTANGPTADQ
ncbi:MAG: hypothetical protein R3F36_02460 [Candidatus Competibacteraceae bacterium]